MADNSGRSSTCSTIGVPVASEILTPSRRATVSGMTVASEILTPRRRATVSGAIISMPAEPSQVRPKLCFDALRLREWFNLMDLDRRGHVSKRRFIDFLVSQPQLQKLFVEDQNPQLKVEPNGWQKRIVYGRMLSRTWCELCENSTHEQEMEWNGFSEFFRRRGMLFQYKTQHNPKDRLASMLADMHIQPLGQDSRTLDEFVRLRRTHLQGQQKRQLGIKELSNSPCALGTPGPTVVTQTSSTCSTSTLGIP